MDPYEITSPSNPRIKRLKAIRERSHPDAGRLFAVEGERLFSRALRAGLDPTEVYGDGSVPYEGPMVLTAPSALSTASYRRSSQGIIALFELVPHGLGRIEPGDPALVLVAEGVEKPGNLGAMLRSASATGADGLVVTGGGVDPFNPNCLRASTGAVFDVPFAVAPLHRLGSWLEDRRIPLGIADPQAPETMWEADLAGPAALLIGSESEGVSPEARRAASFRLSIPLCGSADSLNASVALALVAYEALRQRDAAGH